jgi:polar amino acid transport system substrate-binding protein
VGTNVPFPPFESFASNGETFAGFDMDLIRAVAKGLDLKPKIVNVAFNGLIPALVDGRLNVIISGIGDFTDRETQANFVDYLRVDPEVQVMKRDASQYTSLYSLCGKSMGVQTGSAEVTATQLMSKRCTAAGKPPIHMLLFQEDPQALLALQSGRVQMHTTDGPVAQYEAATIDHGQQLTALFPNFLAIPIDYGILTPKTQMSLAVAIKKELNVLIQTGAYSRLLARYHIQASGLKQAAINAATVSSKTL